MKEKLRNLKFRLIALWWFLTRKQYFLLSYKNRTSRVLESSNIVIPEFIDYVQKQHKIPTRWDVIAELKEIDYLLSEPKDVLAHSMIVGLIKKLKDES